jgi:hypothetical protein
VLIDPVESAVSSSMSTSVVTHEKCAAPLALESLLSSSSSSSSSSYQVNSNPALWIHSETQRQVLPALIHDTLHLVLDYHQHLADAAAAAAAAAATGGSSTPSPVELTSLPSFSPEKFVVLCDEARGTPGAFPDFSKPAEAAAEAVGAAVAAGGHEQTAAANDSRQLTPRACTEGAAAATAASTAKIVVDRGAQKENVPNVL